MVLRRTFLESLGTSTTAGLFGGTTFGSRESSTADSLEGSTNAVTATDTISDRLVGAHYYTWYGPNNHWSNGYTGTPTLGEYDSQDTDVIEQHVEWAENNGINWFNATWWGPDSYSGRTLENHVAPSLANTDVEFSVLYEPKGRFEYNESKIDFGERENREILTADFEHIAAEMVGNPNYLHVDGRPVLYIYIAHTFTGDVEGAFADAQTQADTDFYLVGDYGRNAQLPNPVFDAVSPYNMYRPVEGINDGFADYVAQAYEGWHLLSQAVDFDFVPLALPGFDNTEAEWATDGQPVLNRSPERYRELCTIARRYMNDEREMVLLTSFNEWHEYTSVEPGEEFGTTYLDITNDNLSAGASLAPTRELVPLTFQWQDYVPESSVNPDISEGEGRRLTIAVDKLQLLSGTGSVVETYDIGSEAEPVFTHGASDAESHNGRSWRWFTANRTMTSTLYVPAAMAAETKRVALVCRALEDGFGFAVSLGNSEPPTDILASRGWNEVSRRLQGRAPASETQPLPTTRTETVSSTPSPSVTTSSPPPETTPPTETRADSTTKTGASSPGFGIITAGGAACYAAYRRFVSDSSDGR